MVDGGWWMARRTPVCPCPNGTSSQSPGLCRRRRRYPGSDHEHQATPTALRNEEPTMPQSLSAVYLHLVFSTKERRAFLKDQVLRSECHAYLGGISKKLECPLILAGGVEDHVHLLARQSRSITQADWVKELKRASSLWIKERDPAAREFAWQAGYGVFFREFLPSGEGRGIHREAGRASPVAEFSG